MIYPNGSIKLNETSHILPILVLTADGAITGQSFSTYTSHLFSLVSRVEVDGVTTCSTIVPPV